MKACSKVRTVGLSHRLPVNDLIGCHVETRASKWGQASFNEKHRASFGFGAGLATHPRQRSPLRHYPCAPPVAANPVIATAAVAGAVSIPQQLAPLASLLTIGSVVVIHELGHFSAARAQGIRIKEFSIGFGPQVLKQQKPNGTEYSLRALPLGGYVSYPKYINRTEMEQRGLLKSGKHRKQRAMVKEGFEVENTPDLLENRPLKQQALVASAGVIFNVILAWALYFTSAITLGSQIAQENPVVVSRIGDANS